VRLKAYVRARASSSHHKRFAYVILTRAAVHEEAELRVSELSVTLVDDYSAEAASGALPFVRFVFEQSHASGRDWSTRYRHTRVIIIFGISSFKCSGLEVRVRVRVREVMGLSFVFEQSHASGRDWSTRYNCVIYKDLDEGL
jgi:hypothetical protein